MAPFDAFERLDKHAALAMHKVDELVLLATEDEDLLALPAVEAERR